MRLRDTLGSHVPERRRAWIAHALAIAIAIYGGLLRLDCYVGKYGPLEHPGWARFATHSVAPLIPYIRPARVVWYPVSQPYVGGDPISYIEVARSMTSFYQPDVREPVFPAMTRAGIVALGGQDAGISLASAAGSTLAIFATYLVGAALSPATGLIASLLTATELDMVTWGVDGWRDDTFTATLLLVVWSLLRLREQPTQARAVVVGILAAASCLTRITACTFIVPAFLWILVERRSIPWRTRASAVGTATLVTILFVAPYLISCALATGDPLLAINDHTGYYRFAENQSIDQPMTAAVYLRGRFVSRPVATLDTAVNGLFLQPFITKWHGFEEWMRGLGPLLRAIAAIGLAALPFTAKGRLLLVALLGSLVPYIFTWNVGGGGAWRFTMHAYPFFFVAAGVAVAGAWRIGTTLVTTRRLPGRRTLVGLIWRAAAITTIAIAGAAWYVGLPWYVVREAIARGDSTSIETGERDRVFFRWGWSASHRESITVRVSRAARAVVRLPLPKRRAYDIVLRIDPVVPGTPEQVDVLFNRHLVGRLPLSFSPGRVGSYRIRVREEHVSAGSNEIILVPSSVVPAAKAGPAFAWLDPSEGIGVRLWYVRVVP